MLIGFALAPFWLLSFIRLLRLQICVQLLSLRCVYFFFEMKQKKKTNENFFFENIKTK